MLIYVCESSKDRNLNWILNPETFLCLFHHFVSF